MRALGDSFSESSSKLLGWINLGWEEGGGQDYGLDGSAEEDLVEEDIDRIQAEVWLSSLEGTALQVEGRWLSCKGEEGL